MLRRLAVILLVPLLAFGGAADFFHQSNPAAEHNAVRVRSDLWTRLNDERAARGLPRLKWNGRLSDQATTWSKHMAYNRFIFHSDLRRFTVNYDYIGENVGSAGKGTTAGQMALAFMNSPEHRDNELSPGFTSAGIGVYCGPSHGMWITYIYGRTWADGSLPTFTGGTPPSPIAREDPGQYHC